MITPQHAYVIYVSFKQHFNPSNSYSLKKYNFKYLTRMASSFDKRRDKGLFKKLAKAYHTEEDLRGFLIANMVENPDVWIGDLFTEGANSTFLKWHGRIKRMPYVFESDCRIIAKKVIQKDLKLDDRFFNLVTELMYCGDICLESFIFLQEIFSKRFTNFLDKSTVYEYSYKIKVDAYKEILNIRNVSKYKQIFETAYKEEVKVWQGSKEEENEVGTVVNI